MYFKLYKVESSDLRVCQCQIVFQIITTNMQIVLWIKSKLNWSKVHRLFKLINIWPSILCELITVFHTIVIFCIISDFWVFVSYSRMGISVIDIHCNKRYRLLLSYLWCLKQIWFCEFDLEAINTWRSERWHVCSY